IALLEYLLQVPANRIGYTVLSVAQLKILQEVVTLSVFVPFALLYLKEPIKLDYLWAALCILGAVFFIFRSKLMGGCAAAAVTARRRRAHPASGRRAICPAVARRVPPRRPAPGRHPLGRDPPALLPRVSGRQRARSRARRRAPRSQPVRGAGAVLRDPRHRLRHRAVRLAPGHARVAVRGPARRAHLGAPHVQRGAAPVPPVRAELVRADRTLDRGVPRPGARRLRPGTGTAAPV